MSRLSVTFFADEPCQQPTNLPDTVNVDLITFIGRKSTDAGFKDVLSLSKAFGTTNNEKIVRNLQAFGQTGQLNPQYMSKLVELLNINISDIEAIRRQHNERLYLEEKLFIQYFDLLFSHQDLIIKQENYRNITFHGLGINSAWVGRRRPCTLGELYQHWQNKRLIAPDCCGTTYIFSAGGSALSGSHTYRAICSICKKVVSGQRPTFSEILNPYLQFESDFAYVPTDYTVKQLVADLLEL